MKAIGTLQAGPAAVLDAARARGLRSAAAADTTAAGALARAALSLLVVAVALGVLLMPSPAAGVDTGASGSSGTTGVSVTYGPGNISVEQADTYTVPEGETRKADLYIWARSVEIAGTLDGDVVGFFQSGVVPGSITEDLNGASNSMLITGEVGDDVRFACETFYVEGRIAGDLIVAARDVQIREGAVVEGDVIIACGTATIDGRIGGRARVFTGFLSMNGTVDGNAEITTDGGFSLGPDAHIGGDLSYEGPSRMDIPDSAVAGEVTWHRKVEDESEPAFHIGSGVGLFFHLLGFLMALVAGSVIVALTKDHARRTAETIRTRPLKSLGIGFVTFICMPLVLLVLLVLIITIPLMAVVTFAYLIALYIAKFYFAIWLGDLVLKRGGRTDVSPIPSMLLGLVFVYLATAIPVVGTFIGIVIIFFGLGALLQRKETRLDAAFEPVRPSPNGLPNSFSGTGTEG